MLLYYIIIIISSISVFSFSHKGFLLCFFVNNGEFGICVAQKFTKLNYKIHKYFVNKFIVISIF